MIFKLRPYEFVGDRTGRTLVVRRRIAFMDVKLNVEPLAISALPQVVYICAPCKCQGHTLIKYLDGLDFFGDVIVLIIDPPDVCVWKPDMVYAEKRT